MPQRSDDPLRKCTLNLYASDCAWLEKTYGQGWTERVRQHIHNYVHTQTVHTKVRTLADVYNGTHAYPDEN